jgi:hypothetical protein
MRRLAALVFFIALPAEAGTVVVVPRAPVVVARPMPRVAPAMRHSVRPNGPRVKTTPTYSWLWWSSPAAAPCKKGKDGKCRK